MAQNQQGFVPPPPPPLLPHEIQRIETRFVNLLHQARLERERAGDLQEVGRLTNVEREKCQRDEWMSRASFGKWMSDTYQQEREIKEARAREARRFAHGPVTTAYQPTLPTGPALHAAAVPGYMPVQQIYAQPMQARQVQGHQMHTQQPHIQQMYPQQMPARQSPARHVQTVDSSSTLAEKSNSLLAFTPASNPDQNESERQVGQNANVRVGLDAEAKAVGPRTYIHEPSRLGVLGILHAQPQALSSSQLLAKSKTLGLPSGVSNDSGYKSFSLSRPQPLFTSASKSLSTNSSGFEQPVARSPRNKDRLEAWLSDILDFFGPKLEMRVQKVIVALQKMPQPEIKARPDLVEYMTPRVVSYGSYCFTGQKSRYRRSILLEFDEQSWAVMQDCRRLQRDIGGSSMREQFRRRLDKQLRQVLRHRIDAETWTGGFALFGVCGVTLDTMRKYQMPKPTCHEEMLWDFGIRDKSTVTASCKAVTRPLWF